MGFQTYKTFPPSQIFPKLREEGPKKDPKGSPSKGLRKGGNLRGTKWGKHPFSPKRRPPLRNPKPSLGK